MDINSQTLEEIQNFIENSKEKKDLEIFLKEFKAKSFKENTAFSQDLQEIEETYSGDSERFREEHGTQLDELKKKIAEDKKRESEINKNIKIQEGKIDAFIKKYGSINEESFENLVKSYWKY